MAEKKELTELPLRALSTFEKRLLEQLYKADHALSATDVYRFYIKQEGCDFLMEHAQLVEDENYFLETRNAFLTELDIYGVDAAIKYIQKELKFKKNPFASYPRIQRLLNNLVAHKLIVARKSIGAKTGLLYYLPDSTIKKIKETKGS